MSNYYMYIIVIIQKYLKKKKNPQYNFLKFNLRVKFLILTKLVMMRDDYS